jgi:hypothetical protein
MTGVNNRVGKINRACQAAVATALTESNAKNYANNAVSASKDYRYDAVGSDHLSVGVMQQQTSSYPDVSKDMHPISASEQFVDRLTKISGWNSGKYTIGELCQKVQVSAYPDR